MSFTLPHAKSIPLILGVMTPFPYSIDIKASAEQALAIMQKHRFHHLPVFRDDRLIGVITQRDIEFALRTLSPGEIDELLVGDLYSEDPYVVDDHTRLDRVLHELAEGAHSVAFITRDEKLVGIFTAHDAFRLLGKIFSDQGPIPDAIA